MHFNSCEWKALDIWFEINRILKKTKRYNSFELYMNRWQIQTYFLNNNNTIHAMILKYIQRPKLYSTKMVWFLDTNSSSCAVKNGERVLRTASSVYCTFVSTKPNQIKCIMWNYYWYWCLHCRTFPSILCKILLQLL